MARDKKAKKGQGEETGEEVASKDSTKEQEPIVKAKKSKKGKKANEDEVDIAEELFELSLKDGNSSVKSRALENGDSDVDKHKQKGKDADVPKEEKKSKSSKKGKTENSDEKDPAGDIKSKKKLKSKRGGDSDDELVNRTYVDKSDGDSDEVSERKKKSQKSKLTKKSKNADDEPEVLGVKSAKFQLLDIEDDMKEVDQPSDEEKEQIETKSDLGKDDQKGGKKSKKKSRKKKDDDDEDLDKLLEEIAMEMTGQKPPEKTVEKPKDAVEVGAMESSVTDIEPTEAKTKKKKKKKKDEEVEDQTEEASVADDEQHTVKTAAEKKKEKKEREKQKRQAQFDRQGKSTDSTDVKTKPSSQQNDPTPTAPVTSTEDIQDKDEEDKDEDIDDKKKKKKKKGKDEDDKRDKKKPGKKQLAAMQEALKKMQEEEERLRLEEEAKIKAEEEAERLRLEKIQLELEKKERKKQKEKEKRERLKAEGKLLTKAQRQQRARMEATLAALRQQGVEVPQIGEKKERAPRLGDRPRLKKKSKDPSDPEADKGSNTLENEAPEDQKDENILDEEEVEEKPAESSSEEEEDVKDAWDESSDEDDSKSPSKKVEIVIKSKRKQKTVSDDESESGSDESSDEGESDDSESDESTSESENEGKSNEERIRDRALERIRKRREDNESNRSLSKLRSPVVCVLGHVDTGKTKILDKIRKTNVQTNEVGGITQQIGATMVPQDAIKEQCKMVKNFADMELQVPGLLIIDTPGHESFSNLRSRGSSLCDIAILVVDIMHGLEPQTIESLNLLKQKKTPFIVALNKVDRLYEWKPVKNKDIQDVIKGQSRNTKMEFDDRVKDVILQFANQSLNAVLYYDNKDPRSYVSMVPTSAISGDGMGNLMALVVQLTQSMMAKRLAFSEELQATVLEVKAIPGLGTTVDVILVNGRLHEGDTILLAGYDGPVVTQIRSLLMPQPLKELRVKSPYQEFKEIEGAQGVKLTGKDLDKAIAGLQLLVAHHPDEVSILKDEISSSFREAMSNIKLAERGVYVQASTLGSLEALLDFLRTSKIPYSGIRIGPVVKKDVMKASIMLEHDSQYAVILAFDVKIERDAQELADSLGVRIFQADIIYHLFDKFMEYREELKNKKKDEFKHIAVFPCKMRILPQYIFNSRDPIVVGVIVEAGVVKEGTPICVPSKEFLEIGTVSTIEVNHKAMDSARKGQEVCIKIEPSGGEAPKMYGRHFDHTDILMSKITRQSIDACKDYFRDDLTKTDWQLMVELKKIFQIM